MMFGNPWEACILGQGNNCTNLPPLSSAVTILEEALVKGDSVLAVDKTTRAKSVDCTCLAWSCRPGEETWVVPMNLPPLLLTSSAEGAGSGGLHEAGGGRSDHVDVCGLPG